MSTFRSLRFGLCAVSAAVALTACGGSNGDLNSAGASIAADTSWSVDSSVSRETSSAIALIVWEGTPEQAPAPDPDAHDEGITWWIMDSQTGEYLPGIRRMRAFSPTTPTLDDRKQTAYVVHNGQVFQIDLHQGVNWVPALASSALTDASKIEAYFVDSAGHPSLRVRKSDQRLVTIELDAPVTAAPHEAVQPTRYELTSFYYGDGRLKGRLLIDRENWELVLTSGNEQRVLQRFPLPAADDRTTPPASWIAPQWHSAAGVLQIGQSLHRFDWRQDEATLSAPLHQFKHTPAESDGHLFAVDDKRLYVLDGKSIVSIGASGEASLIALQSAPGVSAQNDHVGQMMLSENILAVLHGGVIERIVRSSAQSKLLRAPSAVNLVTKLVWVRDDSIGFEESALHSQRHRLSQWTNQDGFTVLAEHAYAFLTGQPGVMGSSQNFASGMMHGAWKPNADGSGPGTYEYAFAWDDLRYTSTFTGSDAAWWCDTYPSDNDILLSNEGSIRRYDLNTHERQDKGHFPFPMRLFSTNSMGSTLQAIGYQRIGLDAPPFDIHNSLWQLDLPSDNGPIELFSSRPPF